MTQAWSLPEQTSCLGDLRASALTFTKQKQVAGDIVGRDFQPFRPIGFHQLLLHSGGLFQQLFPSTAISTIISLDNRIFDVSKAQVTAGIIIDSSGERFRFHFVIMARQLHEASKCGVRKCLFDTHIHRHRIELAILHRSSSSNGLRESCWVTRQAWFRFQFCSLASISMPKTYFPPGFNLNLAKY